MWRWGGWLEISDTPSVFTATAFSVWLIPSLRQHSLAPPLPCAFLLSHHLLFIWYFSVEGNEFKRNRSHTALKVLRFCPAHIFFSATQEMEIQKEQLDGTMNRRDFCELASQRCQAILNYFEDGFAVVRPASGCARCLEVVLGGKKLKM